MTDATTPSMPTTPGTWVEYLGRITAPTLLALILVTGAMHVWRWGSDYDEMKLDRNQWKQLALKGTQVAAIAANRVIAGDAPRVKPPSPDVASKFDVESFLENVHMKVVPVQ